MNERLDKVKRKSILSEIVHQMPLCERYLVQEYLTGGRIKYEEIERLKNLEFAMCREKSKWWNSSYPQERAYHQFFCSTLILNFDLYKQDMQRLLRRWVREEELFQREKIIEEVIYKYNKWREKTYLEVQ